MTAADPRSWMWAEACAMIERAEQLHRQFFRPGLARAPAANWEPPVDVFESERELTIVAALPGAEHRALLRGPGDESEVAGHRVAQIVELTQQLRGKAGARQRPGAQVALAENNGGQLAGDSAVALVTILST